MDVMTNHRKTRITDESFTALIFIKVELSTKVI